MLDDSDINFAILVSRPTSIAGVVITIIVILIMAAIVADNETHCRQMTCPAGSVGQLIDHQCLCVVKPAETK